MSNGQQIGTKATSFFLPSAPPIRVGNAGLFISRGRERHPNRSMEEFDLIYVREGELGIQEEERPYVIRPEETVLLWPGRRHWGTTRYAKGLSFYWIEFKVGEGEAPADGGQEIVQHGYVRRPERMKATFDQFLEDQEAGLLSPVTAAALLTLMLCEVGRVPVPEAGRQQASVLAVRAQAFIRTHSRFPLDVSTLAEEVGCNPDYLGRVFREAYGMTLTQGIHERRMYEAKQMLLGTDKNIEEIAHECGFEDSGYFRGLFKRAEGVAAKEYRRRHARTYVNTE